MKKCVLITIVCAFVLIFFTGCDASLFSPAGRDNTADPHGIGYTAPVEDAPVTEEPGDETAPPDTTAPAVVSGFTVTAGFQNASLSWTNPTDADFTGVVLVYRIDRHPASVSDGTVIYEGTETSFIHVNLVNGTTEYYSVFSKDSATNYSSGVQSTVVVKGSGPEISSWTSTTSLPEARIYSSCAVWDGYLYVTGGSPGYTTEWIFDNKIYYNRILSDGSLGTLWQIAGNSLPAARGVHSCIVVDGIIYVIGGMTNSNSSAVNIVYYAPINSDHSIGVWQTTSSLQTARVGLATASLNGFIYVVGGRTGPEGGAMQNTVEVAEINQTNHTLYSWNILPKVFTTARMQLSAVILNSYLYLLGGTTNSANGLSDIQSTVVNADGSIGNWQTVSALLSPVRQLHQSIVYTGRFYAFGGMYHDGTWHYLSKSEYSAIPDTSGQVSSMTSLSVNLPIQLTGHSVIENNGYIYCIGGYDGANNISDVFVSHFIP